MTHIDATETRRAPGSGPIRVGVAPEIADLVPAFLANRRGDVMALGEALESGKVETVRIVGHRLKGMGGGYGFEYIMRAGTALEEAAREGRMDVVVPWMDGLNDYLDRVEVVVPNRNGDEGLS